MALRTKKQWWGVVLDAEDGRALAHFHARLLGWQLFNEDESGAAVEVGAELASYQPQETVRVMLDPAGHPFCLYLDSSA